MAASMCFILFFYSCCGSIVICRQYTAKEVTDIIKTFNVTKYSKDVLPPKQDGRPLSVGVLLYLISVDPSRHRHYALTLDLYLRWQDIRFVFNSSLNDTPIGVALRKNNFIWQPDLWIPNETSGKSNFIVDQYLRLFPNGTVEFVKRLQLHMFCEMEYWYFPFDQQTCAVSFQSYAHSSDELQLFWYRKINTGNYSEVEYEMKVGNMTRAVYFYGPTGSFDDLKFIIYLKRVYTNYITQDYLPYNIVIILSLTTFWIDHSSTPARVTVPTIIIFTLTKLNIDLKARIPFTREPILFEYYLNFSILFVMTILMEYCVVTLFKVKMKKSEKREKENDHQMKPFIIGESGYLQTDFMDVPVKSYNVAKYNKEYVVHPIDKKCRVIFPVVYILYNAVYFFICSSANTWNDES